MGNKTSFCNPISSGLGKRSKIATKFCPLAIVVTDKVTSKTPLLLTELVVQPLPLPCSERARLSNAEVSPVRLRPKDEPLLPTKLVTQENLVYAKHKSQTCVLRWASFDDQRPRFCPKDKTLFQTKFEIQGPGQKKKLCFFFLPYGKTWFRQSINLGHFTTNEVSSLDKGQREADWIDVKQPCRLSYNKISTLKLFKILFSKLCLFFQNLCFTQIRFFPPGFSSKKKTLLQTSFVIQKTKHKFFMESLILAQDERWRHA